MKEHPHTVKGRTMDLPSLMQACLDGLASGSLSAFGSALGAATIALFRKLAGRKGDMDENELKAMSSWADPYKLAAKAAELAKGDPDFNQLLSSCLLYTSDLPTIA